MSRFVDLALWAVVLAGVYAAMAYGLGLIYGVLRVVNLAHGGVIMAGAYIAWLIYVQTGLDPFLCIPIVLVCCFVLGAVMYRLLVRHLPRGPEGGPASLLLLFGVWLVLRNIAYLAFTGDDRAIRTSYSTATVEILGSHILVSRLAVLVIAVVTAAALHLFLRRSTPERQMSTIFRLRAITAA